MNEVEPGTRLLPAITGVRARLNALSSLAFLSEEHVKSMRLIVMALLDGKGIPRGDGSNIRLGDVERDAAVGMLVELADRAWNERGNGAYLPTGLYELVLDFDRHVLSFFVAASSRGDGFEKAFTLCSSYIDAAKSMMERKSQAVTETCEVLPGGETSMEFMKKILRRIESTVDTGEREKNMESA